MRSRHGALLCPLCREDLGRAPRTRCEGCETEYHAECREELGGCAVLGCIGGRARSEPPRVSGSEFAKRLLAILAVFALVVAVIWPIMGWSLPSLYPSSENLHTAEQWIAYERAWRQVSIKLCGALFLGSLQLVLFAFWLSRRGDSSAQ